MASAEVSSASLDTISSALASDDSWFVSLIAVLSSFFASGEVTSFADSAGFTSSSFKTEFSSMDSSFFSALFSVLSDNASLSFTSSDLPSVASALPCLLVSSVEVISCLYSSAVSSDGSTVSSATEDLSSMTSDFILAVSSSVCSSLYSETSTFMSVSIASSTSDTLSF